MCTGHNALRMNYRKGQSNSSGIHYYSIEELFVTELRPILRALLNKYYIPGSCQSKLAQEVNPVYEPWSKSGVGNYIPKTLFL